MRTGVAFVLTALTALLSARLRAAEPPPNLATARVVDLTWPFDAKTIYWPNSPSAFELKSLSYGVVPGGWFYSSNAFCTPEHGGTHLDAPIHFAEKGKTADQVPPRQLIAAAAVIDVSRAAFTVTSTRIAGPIMRSSGIASAVQRCAAKWIGASRWVPPCSAAQNE
jgi:hypothetical protein